MQIENIVEKERKTLSRTYVDSLYYIASKIVLKYGSLGNAFINCELDNVKEFWKDAPYPSRRSFIRHVKIAGLKWYLHNRFNFENEIWNADFLHGLITNGIVQSNIVRFPMFMWYNSQSILKAIECCPFAVNIAKIINKKQKTVRYKWQSVPAIYLKYSTESASFMAGVLAGAEIYKDKTTRITYAKFHKRVLPYFKKWKIPVEHVNVISRYILVSPFWIAIMSYKMPKEVGEKWLKLKRSCGANEYAAILWRTYFSSDFVKGGIPYLRSRRTIMYQFNCEEGAMKRVEKLRVEKDLTELDNRIKDAIIYWKQNIEEETEVEGKQII